MDRRDDVGARRWAGGAVPSYDTRNQILQNVMTTARAIR